MRLNFFSEDGYTEYGCSGGPFSHEIMFAITYEIMNAITYGTMRDCPKICTVFTILSPKGFRWVGGLRGYDMVAIFHKYGKHVS